MLTGARIMGYWLINFKLSFLVSVLPFLREFYFSYQSLTFANSLTFQFQPWTTSEKEKVKVRMIWKNMNETRPNLFSSNTEKNTLLNSVLQQLLIIITIQLYSVIAKNSNKRLKRSVAQCLRSYLEGESYRAWYRKERSKKLNRDYSFKIIFEGQFLA